ncbi:unnamed protein product, partial [Phaeothamnion confervicola]
SARIDPIVNPGKISNHHHDVAGSIAFSPTSRRHMMRTSASTCRLSGDFSNYWAPTIFHKDGEKTTRLSTEFKAYYFSGTSDPDNGHIDVSRFPRNLSMVVGDASGNTTFGDPSFSNIRFACAGTYGTEIYPNGFPADAYCPGGLRISFLFPSCWNGKEYQPDQSHLAYPVEGFQTDTKGTCPKT